MCRFHCRSLAAESGRGALSQGSRRWVSAGVAASGHLLSSCPRIDRTARSSDPGMSEQARPQVFSKGKVRPANPAPGATRSPKSGGRQGVDNLKP